MRTRRIMLGSICALGLGLSSFPAPPVAGQPAEQGNLIVFEGHTQGGGGPSHIYTVDVRTGEITQLTGTSPQDTSEGDNYDPEWSPDGTRIVFESDRDGHRDIFVMDADGQNVTKLTSDPVEPPETTPDGDSTADDWSPTWRHDGEAIAFVSARNGKRKVYLMGTDGRVLRRIKTGSLPIEDDLAWSPCGPRLAVQTALNRSDVHVIRTNGWGRDRITPEGKGWWRNPSWRPNCKRIALHHSHIEDHVYRVRPNGDFLRKTPLHDPRKAAHPNCAGTVDCEVSNKYPAWSSDGGRIAYHHTYNYHEDTVNELRVYNLRTKRDRLIVKDMGFVPRRLHWQPTT